MRWTLFPLLGAVIAFAFACSHAPLEGDRKLDFSEAPAFLKEYSEGSFEEPSLYEKLENGRKLYEAKYKKKGFEVSVKFDAQGNQVEIEEDVPFESLALKTRERIVSHLKSHYPGFVILEVEKRVDEHRKSFIDVEIRHVSSPSGYWEISFTPDGEYASKEVENYQTINTLN